MAEGASGFDMSKWSTAGKILLVGGVVYFIDLFLPWNQVCFNFGGLLGSNVGGCVSVSGFHGMGIINAILVLLVIAMEVVILAGVQVNFGDAAMRSMVDFGLTAGVLVFTVLKVLVDHAAIAYGAWAGLVLSIVIVYGGYMRWSEGKAGAPPASSSGGGGGGFTS